jgi:multiple sugar transport system permease protein
MWFGHSTIILTAGVKAISPELIEAAVVDGAGNGQRFFHITLPLLRPTLLYVAVTSLIGGMQIFDIPIALQGSQGGSSRSLLTMVLYVYTTAFTNKNYSYGATVSYGVFVIILVFSLIFFKVISPHSRAKGGV